MFATIHPHPGPLPGREREWLIGAASRRRTAVAQPATRAGCCRAYFFAQNASRAFTAVSGKSLNTPLTPIAKNCSYSFAGSPA